MSEAYIISSVQYESEPGESDAVDKAVQTLFDPLGPLARRIQEIHWISKAPLPGSLSRAGFPGLSPVFYWKAGDLLDHFILQSVARELESGSRDIVLVVQDWWDETLTIPVRAAVALLFASPVVVGRYNLLPLARLSWMVSFASPAAETFVTLAALLREQSKAAQEAERRRIEAVQAALQTRAAVGDLTELGNDLLPGPEAIGWMASGVPFEIADVESVFPQARRLVSLPPAASGDCFLFDSLLKALKNSRQQWGMLLSTGQERNTLATLIERI